MAHCLLSRKDPTNRKLIVDHIQKTRVPVIGTLVVYGQNWLLRYSDVRFCLIYQPAQLVKLILCLFS